MTPLISAKVTTTTFEGIRTTENSPIHGARFIERIDQGFRTSQKKKSISTQQDTTFDTGPTRIELLQDLPAMGPLRYGYMQKKRSNLQITVLSDRLERRMSMPSHLTPT